MAIEKCINEYDVDDVIFEEGSTGRELFVVLEGKIDIVKIDGASKTVIVTLGKGEFFGEMPVIDGSTTPRTAAAVTAASIAFPPSCSTRRPAADASGWLVAIMPFRAMTTERVECRLAAGRSPGSHAISLKPEAPPGMCARGDREAPKARQAGLQITIVYPCDE